MTVHNCQNKLYNTGPWLKSELNKMSTDDYLNDVLSDLSKILPDKISTDQNTKTPNNKNTNLLKYQPTKIPAEISANQISTDKNLNWQNFSWTKSRQPKTSTDQNLNWQKHQPNKRSADQKLNRPKAHLTYFTIDW